MKRQVSPVTLFAVCFAMLIAFPMGKGKGATVNVDVGPNGSMSFSPNPVAIHAGDIVQWNWKSSSHSVTAGSPSDPTGEFDSGIHNPPFTFTHTFSAAGNFSYYCAFHGAAMSGAVQVAAASPTPTPTPTPSPTPLLPRIGKGPVRIELQTLLTGITSPMQFISANDGTNRMFLVEQTGRIKIFNNGSLNASPFLDLSSRLVALNPSYDERGFLSIAFHPGFANPSSPGYRKIYTYTSEPVSGAADFTVPMPPGTPFNHQSVIAEWQVSAGNPDIIDPATRREVIRIDEPQSNHNGCTLAFRPSDRYLYISLGDGGAANDSGAGHNATTGNGQDLTTVLGKILRIDPLDPSLTTTTGDLLSANGKYRVPISNPFVMTTQPANRVAEIYAIGLRNPFRCSFDAPTDKFVVADVGQDHVEEIDLVEAGKNYGWNRKEGTFLFNSTSGNVTFDSNPDPALTNPLAEYSHDDGIAVLGGFVYHGSAILALPGKYVFGDLVAPGTTSGRLFYLDDLNSGAIREFRIGNDERALGLLLKGFGLDANNELYVLADTNIGPTGTTGRVLKIVPAPASPALVNIATRMRVQTGDNVLIGGFILTGSAPKKVIVRAIGPSLSVNGQPLPGRLLDPTLTLFDGNGSPLFTNDDWMNSPQKQAIVESMLPPNDPKESAIVATLDPGNYTAIMSGVGSATGIGVFELFDLDQSAPANPANISSRGFVETGDNVMIGGFIVGGSQNRTVLARAIGPSLTAVGVPNALQDPTLELHNNSGTTIGSNDNWKSDQQTQITATGLAPPDDRESAILSAPLAPGNYTAIVRGTGTNTGVAVVEIFQLH